MGENPSLRGSRAERTIGSVAAIERFGVPDTTAWLVLRGRVWEGDEEPLLEHALAVDGDVTLDLTEVAELTTGGCWALRRLADHVWERGHRITMLIRRDRPSREPLERTGTIGYTRIRFEETGHERHPTETGGAC